MSPEIQATQVSRRSPLIRIWHLLGMIGLLGSLISLASNYFWIADLVSQLRIQMLLLVIFGIPLWFRNGNRKTLAIAGVVAIPTLWIIVPYFIPQPTHIESNANGRKWRLASFNVLRTNSEIDTTLDEAIASDPDFVFLMETSHDWIQSLKQLSDRYPYQKLLCREDYTGVAFLSKHPWQELQVIDVPDSNPPLDVTFRIGNEPKFRMILTHPLPPISPSLARSRDRQLLTLAETISTEVPTVLAGDFNTTPWSSRFDVLLAKGNLSDASKGYGLKPTLTPLPTWLGGIKIDHVLGNKGITVHSYSVRDTQHSDHRPVVVEFSAH